MRKIPTVFVRDFEHDNGRYVTDEVTPGCEWVLAGEGTATRKYDGTCVMLDDAGWWARREVKRGKSAPAGFRPEQHDETTGKTVGWEPITQSSFFKMWAQAAGDGGWEHGTYELCGPKVNGNPEGFVEHRLIRHALAETLAPIPGPRTVEDVKASVRAQGWEGIVWHHPDGRMAKLKVRDLPALQPA